MSRSILFISATVFESKVASALLGHRVRREWTKLSSALLKRPAKRNGTRFSIGVTGIGPQAARQGLENLLLEVRPVDLVIGLGVAGGLIPTASTGDLVVPETVFGDQKTYTPHQSTREQFMEASQARVWRKLTSLASPLSTPGEKAGLYAASGMEAVDMEAAWWAECCQSKGIPWLVVRSILDTASDDLPHFSPLLDVYGRLRVHPWGLFRWLREKGNVKGTYQIARKANKQAVPAISKALEKWLLDLEPSPQTQQTHQPAVKRKITEFS